ncbi:MAG TPA: chloride channel protein [Terracidiphilus sp.]|nr:chloride channel protein [Terracidiphilus sp.]
MAQRSPQPNVRALGSGFLFPPRFWLLVVMSGVAAGIAGGLLMRLLHATQQIAYAYQLGSFLDNTGKVSGARRVLVLFLAGVIAVVVRRVLKSASGGTGAELSETVWFRGGKMPFWTTVIKGLLSIVMVGMGVSLGREGALKQTGAAIASELAGWFGLSPAQRRLLVACAAGAGMAAAYNVPFGGAIFAVEVLLGTLSLPLMLPALAASFVATGVSFLLLPARPTYVVPAYALHLPDVWWACLAGPVLGLGAFVWLRLIVWADHAVPKGWKQAVWTIAVFTALGAVAVKYPEVLGNGKGLVQRAYLDEFGMRMLLPLFFLKLIAAPGCLSTGSPGGLFTPTLTVGALMGAVLGHLWAMAVPASQMGVFAMIGSAAVLAAATQGPLSSVAFVMELTHHATPLMVPMLLAIVGASLVTQKLDNRSVYSARVASGMRAAEKKVLSGTRFDRLGTEAYSVATSAADYATVVERIFRENEPMFVVDNEGKLVGEICREDLVAREPGIPRSLTTAADLVRKVEAVVSNASEREVIERLGRHGAAMPVVEERSGKLAGAVAIP